MDLLIELIVYLFKVLSGDADARGRSDRPPRDVNADEVSQRGPYNYGDSRARPKTLEEILEEVRRQKQNPSAPGAKPKPALLAPRPQQPQRILSKKSAIPILSNQNRERLERQRAQAQSAPPLAAPLTAPVIPGPLRHTTEQRLRSVLDDRYLANDIEQKENAQPAQLERKFDDLRKREASRFRPDDKEETDAASAAASVAAGKISYVQFFRSMREAPAETRTEMARRAFVFSEVLGPPKALKPHGRR